MFNHMIPDDTTKDIGILLSTTKKRLLPLRTGIGSRFRMHPFRFAQFIANQDIKEGTCRSCNTLLRKQRNNPLFDRPKPRCP